MSGPHRLVTRATRAMGSPLRLVAPGDVVDAAWPLVVGTFASHEAELSRFDAGAGLSRANAMAGSGSWIRASEPLRRALAAAHRGYRVTGGLFDPRIVGALEDLGDRAGVDLPPSPATLRPDTRWLEIDRRRGRLRLASPVDLGGIGKGFTLDAVAGTLERRGVERFLVESGGDVVVRSTHRSEPWRVAMEDPDGSTPAAVLAVRSGGIATSSTRVRRWTGSDGRLLHHLLDPRTGQPATALRSVTVHAPSATWAEVWSTAGFVSGYGIAGMLSGRPALWITASGARRMTGEAARVLRHQNATAPFTATSARRTLAKVNIRSIIAPTLARYPTEYQWLELEGLLREAVSRMPRQTLPEALADEPARSVIDDWRHRHWLDDSARYLP